MELSRIKEIALARYTISRKVESLMNDELFSAEDLIHCIIGSTRIYKKERDELGQAVDGYKYTIIGADRRGNRLYTTGKVLKDYLGNYYFFITAHDAD